MTEVTLEDSSLKLAIKIIDDVFSEYAFRANVEDTWKEWNILYEKQKEMFL
ncbi:MAG: hypothetical protein ACFFAE_16075 [Candidatus Hodarchaeota archaeon]